MSASRPVSTLSQHNIGVAATGSTETAVETADARICPACCSAVHHPALERYGKYELFGCGACQLHFWEPRTMPDAAWYERLYGGRDEKLLPLEPGHRFFLDDPCRPRTGTLLDIGCGTGNFLVAARDAGYAVTGTELDGNAARFARERLGLPCILGLTVSDYVRAHPSERFDIVTFFEVLEHQADPRDFLKHAKACLQENGYIALSVPNRDRWLTAPDVFDYPPNHFLRWTKDALARFLSSQGFQVLSLREQPVGIRHTAQMLNMALRTGMTRSADDEPSTSFRDVMQMASDEAEKALATKPGLRQRVLQALARAKYAACFPLALAAWPYVRMRGYRGAYLYCLARLA